MNEEFKEFNESDEICEETAEEISGENAGLSDDISDEPDVIIKHTKKKKKVLKEILSWAITIIAALAIAIFVNIYIFRISSVNGKSMENSYHNGQNVIVSKIPYIFSEPKRGDVVIFDAQQIKPGERTFIDDYKDIVKYNVFVMNFKKDVSLEHKYYIKRVIGVPGDEIEINENGLFVNGNLIEEDYIKDQDWAEVSKQVKLTVRENCVFVLGDNRKDSRDSRYIGEISYDSLLGKVLTKSGK